VLEGYCVQSTIKIRDKGGIPGLTNNRANGQVMASEVLGDQDPDVQKIHGFGSIDEGMCWWKQKGEGELARTKEGTRVERGSESSKIERELK
jgi:hypothetical protein